MNKRAIGMIVLCVLAMNLWAQTTEKNTLDRPTVALVLAGGGARGFSHIAFIELLDELGIPIDMIIGTSAGALVGGLYSAGYSSSEIADAMLYLDWPTLFNDSTTRPLESGLGSHSSLSNIINIQLKGDLSLDLGKGLLTGQNVYNRLKALTVKIPSYIHFDSLITPFRATTVDLLSGELVVIEQGDLVEAMRASMSIPAVFEPFPIDGNLYMDGFTRNNLPIQVAKDLGYDIIIAVEITDKLLDEEETFNANPLVALNQVLALQQNVVVSRDYELADLIMYPDIYEYGQMDYALAPSIYSKGKKEAEKYREDLVALRERIFPAYTEDNGENTDIITEVDENESHSFSFVVEEHTDVPYMRQASYEDLSPIIIEDIVMKNALSSDEKIIENEFAKIKNIPLGENAIESLLKKAYSTGNYTMVKARIDKRYDKTILELDLYQKDRQVVHIGAAGTFEGSLSKSSTWAINLTTVAQFRNLNDAGGVVSLEGSFLNDTGFELMYFQPVSEKTFLRTTANIISTLDVVSSGFSNNEVSGSQFREASFLFGCGVFFNLQHKLYNEIGLHWVDATQAHTVQIDTYEHKDPIDLSYAFDFSSRYTFSTLNYSIFPTKGFYNDLHAVGVMPIFNKDAPIIFDVLSTDFVIAIPFSHNVSMVLNGFMGTNVSEGLEFNRELITKYGFTTYDRLFFPHVMQRYKFGIHKLAMKVDFQFQPKSQLTILGGQFFAGFGVAAGDVWSNYASFVTLESLDWQVSALTGLRIKDTVGVSLRLGAGSVNSEVAPFVSLDFMVKHY